MAHTRKTQLSPGFTMIELSIVIIVITLIMGSIVIGSEYVRDARIQKQINQLTTLQSAVSQFETKYNCTPGDCADPSAIPPPTDGSSIIAGDGNGFLASTWNATENKQFWLHLSKSEILQGLLSPHGNTTNMSGMSTPRSAINDSGMMNVLGAPSLLQNIILIGTDKVSGALGFTEMVSLDEKMDDGIAAKGFIQTTGYGTGSSVIYASAPSFPASVAAGYSSLYSGSTRCIASGVYSGGVSGQDRFCNLVYILAP